MESLSFLVVVAPFLKSHQCLICRTYLVSLPLMLLHIEVFATLNVLFFLGPDAFELNLYCIFRVTAVHCYISKIIKSEGKKEKI